MKHSISVLVVDDEKTARYGIKKTLAPGGRIFEAAAVKTAIEVADREKPDLILLDLNLGGESGFEVLNHVRKFDPPPLVVMITAHGNEKIAVDAMKKGAFDYLAKPFEIDELRLIVRNAAEQITLRRENLRLRNQLAASGTGYGGIIGRSPAMQRVFSMIEKVAATDVTVLITGESGSGKELVAREIHKNSPRAGASLVTVNCAAMPENLIESELFGHEKGAFTGAFQRRTGKFEKAEKGTIFLDEIGDMPLETQAKILRALEEKTIEPLGGSRTTKVDVRVISATNQDLKKMVEEGTFREDLYYRLEVVNIHIPPLRNRPEDIPALIDYFLRQYGKKHGKEDLKIRPSAYAFLLRYGYPGNVRQLRNVIERLVVLSDKSDIDESDLPEEIRFYEPGEDSTVSAASFAPLLGLGFRAARERFEKKYLLAKLAEHNNNITHTAEAIGVHRQSLQQKIKDLNLKRFLG